MLKRYAVPLGALGLGVAGIGYASVIERNWFRLRRFDVPVLAPGQRPVKILHISDTHLTPGRRRLINWVAALDSLEPDLVVNTGDSISHPDAIGPFLSLLGPLLDRPGVFVYGSNDMYSPVPKNPARYLWRTSRADYAKRRTVPDLPYKELGAALTAAGWLDLNNHVGSLKVGDLEVQFGGINDSHIGKDRYDEIMRPGVPGRAEHRRHALPGASQPRPLRRGRLPAAAGGPHARRAAVRPVLRSPGDELRHRPPARQGPAPPRGHLAPRVGGPGHVTVRPGALLLPPGGLPAHIGPGMITDTGARAGVNVR